jgi:putative transposase
VSGRERRLKQNSNHVISTRIVERNPHSLIGVENLTDIGERIHRTKGKNASTRQRRGNAVQSKWVFAELHGMIASKALLHESMTIKVDAHSTSQAMQEPSQ